MHQRGGPGNVDCQPRARHVNPFTVRSCWCVTGVGAPYLSHGGLPVDNGGLAMDTSIPLLFLRPTSPSSVSTSLSLFLCSRRSAADAAGPARSLPVTSPRCSISPLDMHDSAALCRPRRAPSWRREHCMQWLQSAADSTARWALASSDPAGSGCAGRCLPPRCNGSGPDSEFVMALRATSLAPADSCMHLQSN